MPWSCENNISFLFLFSPAIFFSFPVLGVIGGENWGNIKTRRENAGKKGRRRRMVYSWNIFLSFFLFRFSNSLDRINPLAACVLGFLLDLEKRHRQTTYFEHLSGPFLIYNFFYCDDDFVNSNARLNLEGEFGSLTDTHTSLSRQKTRENSSSVFLLVLARYFKMGHFAILFR